MATEIRYDDNRVWDLLCSGRTKGVFQMESPLCQRWIRKIKPRNIWELAAVIALIRPGAIDGVNDYIAYKEGSKDFISFGHPVIDEVLSNTHHTMYLQETLMLLGDRLAWSHLPYLDRCTMVDKLRKGVGKKDQAKLNAIGKEFVKGCIQNKVDANIADRLFQMIKDCGRYLFNLSHAISYAFVGYEMAYQKVYYPDKFYAVALSYSQEKIDPEEDIRDLIQEMRLFGIEIQPPNINCRNAEFRIESSTSIRYGLSHIKFFGDNYARKLDKLPPIKHWQHMILAGYTKTYGFEWRANTMRCLIKAGALSDIGLPRHQLLTLANLFDELTPREITMLVEHFDGSTEPYEIADFVRKHVVANVAANRSKKLTDILRLFEAEFAKKTHPAFIEECEMESLGLVLTASSLDAVGIIAKHTCADCPEDSPVNAEREILVKIKDVRFKKTKKGDPMAKVDVFDNSGYINHVCVFSEMLEKYQEELRKNCVFLMTVCKGNYGGWFVKHMQSIS
jgi:DNA polymerase-3 subunit alpha